MPVRHEMVPVLQEMVPVLQEMGLVLAASGLPRLIGACPDRLRTALAELVVLACRWLITVRTEQVVKFLVT